MTTIRMASTAFLPFILCSLAAAQPQTFVVDAAGGPGADFLDLPPAVAAAGHGDVLLVRKGAYLGFTTTKGITIVGEGTPVLTSPIKVQGTLPGNAFALQGVKFDSGAATTPLRLQSCAGRLLIDRVTFASGQNIRVDGCAEVEFVGCTSTQRPLLLTGSLVTLNDSSFTGPDASPTTMALPAVFSVDTRLFVSRCTLVGGGQGLASGRAAPAIEQHGTTVLTDDGSTEVRVGPGAPATLSAVVGSGSVEHAPAVTFVAGAGAPAIHPALAVATRPIPSLRATGAGPGGAIASDLFATPGGAFAVVIGVPASPVPLPGLRGLLWLDASGPLVFVAVGVIPASGRFSFSIPVPAGAGLLPQALRFQAVATAAGTAALSNAAGFVLN